MTTLCQHAMTMQIDNIGIRYTPVLPSDRPPDSCIAIVIWHRGASMPCGSEANVDLRLRGRCLTANAHFAKCVLAVKGPVLNCKCTFCKSVVAVKGPELNCKCTFCKSVVAVKVLDLNCKCTF